MHSLMEQYSIKLLILELFVHLSISIIILICLDLFNVWSFQIWKSLLGFIKGNLIWLLFDK